MKNFFLSLLIACLAISNAQSYSVSGTVRNDANGLNNNTVDGIGIGSPSFTQLYAYLVNSSNLVVDRTTVNINGTYGLTNAALNVNYTVFISTSLVNIGTLAPSSAALPLNWVAVGENFGVGNMAGMGNESGTPNMKVAVLPCAMDITNLDFGIEQLPSTVSKTVSACPNCSVQSPSLKGSDPEDGSYGQGSANTFLIRSVPSNGELYYNGSRITPAMVSGNGYLIANYDSTKMTVTSMLMGAGTVSFTYAARDAAGRINTSSVSTISLTCSGINISGTVFHDANGLCGDGVVNGTGRGNFPCCQLYAYLVNTSNIIVDRVVLPSNGQYTFYQVPASTNYEVVISCICFNIGLAAPSNADLPLNWVEVGDAYGTNNGAGSGNEAGTPDMRIAVMTGTTSSITDVNFGVDEKSVADSKDFTNQDPNNYNTPSGNATFPYMMILFNMSGTRDGNVSTDSMTVLPGRVSGSDPEDGLYSGLTGSEGIRTFVLTTLPDYGATVLVYNNGVSDVLLVPDPTIADPSYVYWNSATSQYEIPSFRSDRLKAYFNIGGQQGFGFEYAWLDAACVQGLSALYNVETTIVMPVKLISFTGQEQNKHIQLTWVTAQEENMSHYIMEKNVNGNYIEIARIESKTNSISQLSYAAIDNAPLSVNVYRLRAIDLEGSEEVYFTTVNVQGSMATVNISQVNDANTILINGMDQVGMLRVMSINGSNVANLGLMANTSQTIQLDGIAQGVYIVEAINNSGKVLATAKVIK